jgi:hypothetical protein
MNKTTLKRFSEADYTFRVISEKKSERYDLEIGDEVYYPEPEELSDEELKTWAIESDYSEEEASDIELLRKSKMEQENAHFENNPPSYATPNGRAFLAFEQMGLDFPDDIEISVINGPSPGSDWQGVIVEGKNSLVRLQEFLEEQDIKINYEFNHYEVENYEFINIEVELNEGEERCPICSKINNPGELDFSCNHFVALELEDSLHWIQPPALEELIEEVEAIQSILESNPEILEKDEDELMASIDPESYSAHSAISNLLSKEVITIDRSSVDDELSGYSWYLPDFKIITQRLHEITELRRELEESLN